MQKQSYPRLRMLRAGEKITQEELGKILGCSQRVYSDYERGRLDIPTSILISLADYYHVSIDYILGRTDN